MTNEVIRSLLCEKADLIKAGIRMPAESEERFVNDLKIALIDHQLHVSRERLELRRRTIQVNPILKVG